MLEKQPFDLIILDILMPGLNGIELIPIVRSKYPNVKIAMHAASIQEEHEHLALDLGAMEFWRKPMDPDEILDRVSRILGSSGGG
jgi:DNA-binding response OmpR family regulator